MGTDWLWSFGLWCSVVLWVVTNVQGNTLCSSILFIPCIVTRRRGRRRKKLLDDLKDRRGYCQLKEEALDHTMWRNRFGRDFGPVV